MEESAEMVQSQRAKVLVDHAAGTADKLDAARMEESAAMARSQQETGLIDHATGTASDINDPPQQWSLPLPWYLPSCAQ